ncbi:MAG: hypothetical protein GW858_03070 [Sphingomonadales bacterium]|nr:hypothetical protein [Sphingomonadales bacterium]NCQ20830.1 hypothetical protein [Sphingomonadales bacterium]NCT02587.1 hypothetical protein [Sphingomonadales bacterium]
MTTRPAPRSSFRFHPTLWLCAAVLLAFPALGTMMSDEVNWGAGDFAIFGLMLAGLCAGLEAAWHLLASPMWRIGAALLAVLIFLTLWAHLAVDLFD